MKNSATRFWTLSILTAIVLVGCKDESPPTLQESYAVQVGTTTFNIPSGYIVDSRNRHDGIQNYVVVTAALPSLAPLPEGEKFRRAPSHTSDNIQLNLNDNYDAFAGLKNVIRSADKKSTVIVPDLKMQKDGVIRVGYNDKPVGLYQDYHILVKDGEAKGYLRCGRKPEEVNPGCYVFQVINKTATIDGLFLLENLKWYSDGGWKKIDELVNLWQTSQSPH